MSRDLVNQISEQLRGELPSDPTERRRILVELHAVIQTELDATDHTRAEGTVASARRPFLPLDGYRTLAAFSSALQSVITCDTVAAMIVHEVMQVMPVSGVAVSLHAGSEQTIVDAFGTLARVDGLLFDLPESATSFAVHDVSPSINVRAWSRGNSPHPLWQVLGGDAVHLMRLSLTAEQTEVGALWVATAEALPDAQLAFLASLAETAAAALQRALLYEEAQGQAMRLNRTIMSLPCGLLLLDTRRCVTLVNEAGEAMLALMGNLDANRTLSHLGGRSLDELLLLGAEPRAVQEITHSGRVYEVDAAALRVEGQHDGWMLALQDVTEERATDADIKQRERLAAVGQLAAGIAHDFNNIMAVILLYVQMMQRHDSLEPADRQRLSIIQEQAEHAGKLVRQILDFSRQSMVDRRALDLAVVVNETVKLWERTLPEHIQIELRISPAPSYSILGDVALIQQVLTNLVLNATDAMPNGGLLYIELERATFGPDYTHPHAEIAPGEWIRLRIGDTGTGIPEQSLPHVFDPFFTTKGVGKGTGLGLAQVYGIVKQHRGYVKAYSRMGEGTVVEIYLPDQGDSVVTASTGIDEEIELSEGSGTILLVEDDKSARAATAAILEMIGFHVLHAANGLEGLGMLRKHANDIRLIVTDVVMPEMGGVELMRHAQAEAPGIKAIFMSGYLREDVGQEVADFADVGWLEKPFTVRQLQETVLAAIQ